MTSAIDENAGDEKNRRSKRIAAPMSSMNGVYAIDDTDPSTDEDGIPAAPKSTNRRISSRSNKFSSSLAEPMDSLAAQQVTERRRQTTTEGSPVKSPARRHAQRRRSLPHPDELSSSEDDADSDNDETSVGDSSANDEDNEPLKIQRILASRSETSKQWKEVCKMMNTSEIDYGSRWFQDPDEKDDDTFEERFLVKWADLSYLHVSWESQNDIIEQVEGANLYLSTFFRKSHHGLLFSADERNDGDYFDPAFTEIDRVLDISAPEVYENEKMTIESENGFGKTSFGMVFEKSDPNFENGTGRQFLIKWKNTPYSDATYEFERDLILCDVEYKDHVKALLARSRKPSRKERELMLRNGQLEQRRLERTIFGLDNEEERITEIERYQKELQSVVYKNGGQLRDYQAEGITWMLSNYLDNRSSILADEMGLGKTLQTAAFVNILKTKLCRVGPVLVVVPLSTISHWQREFHSWTDLNTIIYHGSATDRDLIRQFEMAYECDRPQAGVAFNQLFLRKCGPRKHSKLESPWMIDVVITTPEMIVTDDYAELTAIRWELVVIDEAHRLKNRSSKLAVNLRDQRFQFESKLLLTGTPIQNSVEEFWSLLSIVDTDEFGDRDAFMKAYGDMKSKESIDVLHETIRPYILRRLKEDVEKSVPQKSETLIEVELTLEQKQWYRALFEKNLKFLHKNNKKGLDGPGLNNLAMQLRKCCNHLFLLKGAEEDFRRENCGLSEVDHLVKASGKLVLLDKLLPRLKEEGHRVLIFSQFKIMLDILEDYLNLRSMRYERIDGSITGSRRQQAIDRFQALPSEGKEAPFIMMLTTRAGGVGINLTAADTVIIFDSDFNPQADIQAQARCHRIGQTKSVKIYRLLTRKTYEIQMFHISSLKMGLDQAVLKGFENNSSGEGALSKEEVEKLLRHGAYDIFNEEKAGNAEAESNDFIQSDIDAILGSRSRTVVHENTGSQSNAAGGTFSKARFTMSAKSSDPNNQTNEDIDIEDPDFWVKMIGEPNSTSIDVDLGPRQRTKSNYSDAVYQKSLEFALGSNESNSESDSDSDVESVDPDGPRFKWGGKQTDQWNKDDVDFLIKILCSHGYNLREWKEFTRLLTFSKYYNLYEVKRMTWSLILTTVIEVAKEEAEVVKKKEGQTPKYKDGEKVGDKEEGGVLATNLNHPNKVNSRQVSEDELDRAFKNVWESVSLWIGQVVHDAVEYATAMEPRDKTTIYRILRKEAQRHLPLDDINSKFSRSVWPSLKSRGWTVFVEAEGDSAGKTKYSFANKEFFSIEDVLQSARNNHPELSSMLDTHLQIIESRKAEIELSRQKTRSEHLLLSQETATIASVTDFLEHYAPLQLVYNRNGPSNSKKVRLGKRLLSSCTLLHNTWKLVKEFKADDGDIDLCRLQKVLVVDKKSWVPHPQWSSRHDAVLLYAIWKHGWIEDESCCRAISSDPSICWGAPFDSKESSKSSFEQESQLGNRKVIEVARRAAYFMNKESKSLESGELKAFDRILVARTYGLIKEKSSNFPESSPKWTVDSTQLQPETGPATELPTKKDLVKRAKLVLSRVTTASTKSESIPDKVDHPFTVLDQRDRCNVFLCEILRCLVKTPAASATARRLCETAVHEATALFGSESPPTTSNGESKPESREIMNQVFLVKRSLSKGAAQAKNVCRVMLGEEPVKPKKATDALFPSLKVAELVFAAKNGSYTSKSGNVNPLSSSGLLALQRARKRLKEAVKLPKTTNASNYLLPLTETETLILSIACAHGIPEYYKDPHASESLPNEQGWKYLGSVLLKSAREKLNELKRKIREAKEDGKHISELLLIESEFLEMDAVASQAQEYAAEPETLAKKVMMMIAKLHQLIVATFSNQMQPQAFDGLGPKIPSWFDKETAKWGAALDLLDDSGKPLGFSAIDFLFDVPDEDRKKIRMASSLDRKGCQLVFCQISLLTRVRSFVRKYHDDDFRGRVEKAAMNIIQHGDKFFDEPKWWSNGKGNDQLLLERIVKVGLTNELVQQFLEEEGGTRDPFSLSEFILQRRANQLARELHMIDASMLSFERLEKLQSQRNTEAETKSKPNSKGHQTGMLSFLHTKPVQSQTHVIDLSREDSLDNLKRKLTTDVTDSSSEKKHRHT